MQSLFQFLTAPTDIPVELAFADQGVGFLHCLRGLERPLSVDRYQTSLDQFFCLFPAAGHPAGYQQCVQTVCSFFHGVASRLMIRTMPSASSRNRCMADATLQVPTKGSTAWS